jgi:hypothetical protein
MKIITYRWASAMEAWLEIVAVVTVESLAGIRTSV